MLEVVTFEGKVESASFHLVFVLFVDWLSIYTNVLPTKISFESKPGLVLIILKFNDKKVGLQINCS